MPSTPAAPLPSDLAASHDLLHALLGVALPGIILFRPVYAAAEPATIIDLAYVQLNPAAQQMLRLPAQPAETFLTLYPSGQETGIFAFYRDTFLAGQPGEFAVNYPYDGLNNFFLLTARRSGELLVVGFSDTAGQERSQVEQALRESQAREQAAHAQAKAERQRLYQVLLQLPASVAINRGPTHIYELVNPRYQQLFHDRLLQGLPIGVALPELWGQGIIEKLDHVYRTGTAHYDLEQETWVDITDTGQPERRYYNVLFHPLRDAHGHVDGLLNFAYDVTAQVQARQQVEQLNEELAASNEELRALNDEFLASNAALTQTQHQLEQLNKELEARVATRTREVHEQQAELRRLFAQAPMAIAVLRGPQLIIEQANEQAERIWGRPAAEVLGRPHFEALADVAGQGFEELLAGVLQTGEPVVLHEVPVVLARNHTSQPNTGYYSIIFKPLRNEQQVTGIAVMWTEQTDQVLARQQVQDLNEELAAINEELLASNEELNKSNTQLTRTNVDLDTFIYTASHDLKAPISNIEAILLALQARLPAEVQQDELVAQLLAMLQGTVTRFQLTIAQLTDITKLQLAHAGPAEPVHLAPVIEAVRQDLAPLLEAGATVLTVDVAPALVVSFSPANLRSIVYNLLHNASKYRAPDRPSQVQVHAGQTPQAVVLTVQDNGLGMSEVQQRQLFGLFQRLHTHVEGTGVGLYIVKRLVENGGGTITVHSQPDVGTTFTVTFPHPGA